MVLVALMKFALELPSAFKDVNLHQIQRPTPQVLVNVVPAVTEDRRLRAQFREQRPVIEF